MTIELHHVSKQYGRHTALDDVSLTIVAGQMLGLVGPNGAGKTTLLRIVAGLVRPSSGSLARNAVDQRGAVRYFGGGHTLPPYVRADRWVRLWIPSSPQSVPPRSFGVLSRGTRQRIGLEVAMASETETLLLLDEPWEGLDPDASRWLSDAIVRKRSRGVAVVVSSHRIHDLAAIYDRCEFLFDGRLVPVSIKADQTLPAEERAARLLQAFDEAKR